MKTFEEELKRAIDAAPYTPGLDDGSYNGGFIDGLEYAQELFDMNKETLDKHENDNDFIADVSHRFSKEDLWDAWWASAIKTISFSGVNKEYERRCFEKFYENKLSSSNGA